MVWWVRCCTVLLKKMCTFFQNWTGVHKMVSHVCYILVNLWSRKTNGANNPICTHTTSDKDTLRIIPTIHISTEMKQRFNTEHSEHGADFSSIHLWRYQSTKLSFVSQSLPYSLWTASGLYRCKCSSSVAFLWQKWSFWHEFNKTNSTYFSRVYKTAHWKSYKVFLKDRWEKWKQFKSFPHFVFIHHHMITKQQILLLFFITVL